MENLRFTKSQKPPLPYTTIKPSKKRILTKTLELSNRPSSQPIPNLFFCTGMYRSMVEVVVVDTYHKAGMVVVVGTHILFSVIEGHILQEKENMVPSQYKLILCIWQHHYTIHFLAEHDRRIEHSCGLL